MTFGARARIRRGAIRHNLQIIKARCPGSPVMAMIKANAYGHGLLAVAQTLSDVDSLAIARLAEAKALRGAGIGQPIVLLGGILSADELDEVLALDLELVVHDEQQIRWLAEKRATLPVIWLKIDTGMRRLGIRPEVAPKAIETLRAYSRSLRLMTQFSSADDMQDPATSGQLETFRSLIGGFDGEISAANSPLILGWTEVLAQFAGNRDVRRIWVRPGIALYGISPFSSHTGSDFGLQPAMQFEAKLMSVKRISAGDRVGYGGTWQAKQDTVLGIIAAGYGDGYSRFIPSGTPVLVNGRRVAVAGRISMDLTAVDLGPGACDNVGDLVLLWGDGLPVEEVAAHTGTMPYQLVSGVTHREQALYVE